MTACGVHRRLKTGFSHSGSGKDLGHAAREETKTREKYADICVPRRGRVSYEDGVEDCPVALGPAEGAMYKASVLRTYPSENFRGRRSAWTGRPVSLEVGHGDHNRERNSYADDGGQQLRLCENQGRRPDSR